jgi:hypothetical protein
MVFARLRARPALSLFEQHMDSEVLVHPTHSKAFGSCLKEFKENRQALSSKPKREISKKNTATGTPYALIGPSRQVTELLESTTKCNT